MRSFGGFTKPIKRPPCETSCSDRFPFAPLPSRGEGRRVRWGRERAALRGAGKPGSLAKARIRVRGRPRKPQPRGHAADAPRRAPRRRGNTSARTHPACGRSGLGFSWATGGRGSCLLRGAAFRLLNFSPARRQYPDFGGSQRHRLVPATPEPSPSLRVGGRAPQPAGTPMTRLCSAG